MANSSHQEEENDYGEGVLKGKHLMCALAVAMSLTGATANASEWKGELAGRDENGRIIVRPLPKAPKAMKAPDHIKAIVDEIAPMHGIDVNLVLAVIAVESAFNAVAVSHKNAQGLMQIIPATFARFGGKDPFDERDNIRVGVTYLKWLLERFNGNLTLSIAAYNSGPGAVGKYGGVPPYPETIAYVDKVMKRSGISYAADVVESPEEKAPQAPKFAPFSFTNPWEPR